MAMFDQTEANAVLAYETQQTNPAAVTSAKQRLGSTTPTATSNMTELTGSGYTAGGQAVTYSTPSGASTSNSAAISWTNGSGTAWTVNGTELWDTQGTPKRHLEGALTGAPVSVANGNVINFPIAAISAALV
jgi:hypothetical protein